MAKKGQVFKKYSPEFKLSVILDMRNNHLGLRETERKYSIDHHILSSWERKYLEEGYEGLNDVSYLNKNYVCYLTI